MALRVAFLVECLPGWLPARRYVLTDSSDVRWHTSQQWPGKVAVDLQGVIEHTVKNANPTSDGFYQAAAEVWGFGLVDFHVITKKSGFGKVGAMVAATAAVEGGAGGGRGSGLFSIAFPMQFFNWRGVGGLAFDNRKNLGWQPDRKCTRDASDDLAKVCVTFTGC